MQSPSSNDFGVNKIICSSENKLQPKKAGKGRMVKKKVTHSKECYIRHMNDSRLQSKNMKGHNAAALPLSRTKLTLCSTLKAKTLSHTSPITPLPTSLLSLHVHGNLGLDLLTFYRNDCRNAGI
ncbi:uncharacterized [Tachysurus ichikawai]